jgi:hypothetical protein
MAKAIIHSNTGYGGYYLCWVDDSWGNKAGINKANMIVPKMVYK